MSAERIAVNTGLLNGIPALYLQTHHFKAPGQMGRFVHALQALLGEAQSQEAGEVNSDQCSVSSEEKRQDAASTAEEITAEDGLFV